MREEEWERWYRYETACPKCGKHTMQGCWSRPDVHYRSCNCGFNGELSTTVTELTYHNGVIVSEHLYRAHIN